MRSDAGTAAMKPPFPGPYGRQCQFLAKVWLFRGYFRGRKILDARSDIVQPIYQWPFCHTTRISLATHGLRWTVSGQVKAHVVLTCTNAVSPNHIPMTAATHCQHMPINKVWRRTDLIHKTDDDAVIWLESKHLQHSYNNNYRHLLAGMICSYELSMCVTT